MDEKSDEWGGILLASDLNRNYGKQLAIPAVLLFLMNINRLFAGPPLKSGLAIAIWATLSAILIVPKSWWNGTRLWIAAGVVAVEAAAGLVWFREPKLAYFIAIMVLAAAIRLFLSKSPAPAIAAMLVTALLYIRFGSEDVFNILTFALLAVVLYFNIRSRMQRNEMYELNKRHLKELQEAYDQLQEASVTAMQYAVLEERTRIARDIHDSVGHTLTSLIVQIQALRYMIKQDAAQAERSLEGMLAAARQGLHDIRTSVHSLADDRSRSGVVSLKALLSRMKATTSIGYTFHSDSDSDSDEADADVEVYGILFKVLQEAVTNAIRYSGATMLDVSLTRESGHMVMRIRDNGNLEPGRQIREGFGLQGMRARVEGAGGRLGYSAAAPHGLEILATIPYTEG